MERFSKALFLVSLAVLGVLFGSVGAMYGWFPHPQLRSAEKAWVEFSANWRNDLALEPTRHIVAAQPAGRDPFVVHDPDGVTDGYVLIAGLAPDGEHIQGASLYAADGSVTHRWPIDYNALDPEGKGEFNVLIHGVAAYPDGSLIAAFDAGNVLVRIGACGETRWVVNDPYHHVVSPNSDGTLWSWRGEWLVKIDAATGEVLDEFDFRPEVVKANDMYGTLAIRTEENKDKLRYFDDPFHTNDVEALDASMADAFPDFDAGDLLISLRELNLVGVLDPESRRFRWFRHGPWFKQHDPDFQPDGTISVYDNRMGLGESRILAIDPTTGDVSTLLADSQDTPFYSWRRGKHQILENGNLLVTESERGRVFEVTADGQLVWERHMIYDDTQNYIVTSADHLPADFFDDGAFDCDP